MMNWTRVGKNFEGTNSPDMTIPRVVATLKKHPTGYDIHVMGAGQWRGSVPTLKRAKQLVAEVERFMVELLTSRLDGVAAFAAARRRASNRRGSVRPPTEDKK